MKIHINDNGKAKCGTNLATILTDDKCKVTCVKCKRLLADSKPDKCYEVSIDSGMEKRIVFAPTASKATYKAFKNFFYNDDFDIGEEFLRFRKLARPKTRLLREAKEKTLTDKEVHELALKNTEEQITEWNEKYPIGTKVWFQADGADTPIITKTRSKAQNYGTYMTIFLEGVSGSYHLDNRWVLPYSGNENIKKLR